MTQVETQVEPSKAGEAEAASTAGQNFRLSKFSLRRGSVQTTLSLIVLIGLLIGATVVSASNGHTLLTILAATAAGVCTLTTAVLIRIGNRSVALEVWIRRMGLGDLEYKVEMKGKDEIVELTHALETLRQSSIRAMQLDLVQMLSQEVQGKNDQLEQALDELRKSQDQIVSQQKLAELGELSAGVAHEIRNPLQFIKNFAESSRIMMEQLTEILDRSTADASQQDQEDIRELSGDLKENMERINQHSNRANRIVSDMVELRRSTQSKFRSVDINRLLVEQATLAYQAAQAQAPGFYVEVRQELDPEAGEIEAIPEDLGRVFINLTTNACHATAEKRIKNEGFAPVLWLKMKRQPDAMEIRIEDNGMGMTPQVMGKIFNPFFTTKQPTEGTGLGLSLSHDIVRQHGGTITPASEPGEYTEMTITLPL